MGKIVEVAAAVLLRRGGREFLLAQRPEGKVCAGFWEFPGGKLEPGETARQALVRELEEELGIHVTRAWPWITKRYTYPHADVHLKFFRITAWEGEIRPLEHAAFQWVAAGTEPGVAPLLPANGPILKGLALPDHYALTLAEERGVEAELARLERACQGTLRLIQVRDKGLPPEVRASFAQKVVDLAHAQGAKVLINDDGALARLVGADGLHCSSATLADLPARPDFPWVAASCHNGEELARAAALDLDFAVLGPVLPTPSHPQAEGLGWERFAALVQDSPLPVYALGGMRPDMAIPAKERGAQGVALMRGW